VSAQIRRSWSAAHELASSARVGAGPPSSTSASTARRRTAHTDPVRCPRCVQLQPDQESRRPLLPRLQTLSRRVAESFATLPSGTAVGSHPGVLRKSRSSSRRRSGACARGAAPRSASHHRSRSRCRRSRRHAQVSTRGAATWWSRPESRGLCRRRRREGAVNGSTAGCSGAPSAHRGRRACT